MTEEQQYDGIVAFQRVEINYLTFAGIESRIFDTKIMKDGTQLVIDGNGWVGDVTQII